MCDFIMLLLVMMCRMELESLGVKQLLSSPGGLFVQNSSHSNVADLKVIAGIPMLTYDVRMIMLDCGWSASLKIGLCRLTSEYWITIIYGTP